MKRRAMVRLAGAAVAAAALPRVAVGQSTAAATLKFVPQDNLTSLDPTWATIGTTTNHGWAVYDTLYVAATPNP